jgi:anthranilate phosphoribosyltransferase
MNGIRSNLLLPFLQKVGDGPRGARHLSREEAREAARAILEGEWDPVTLGGFLLAMRWKGETEEELAGLLEGLRDFLVSGSGFEGETHAYSGDSQAPELGEPARRSWLDVSGAYDGREETVPVGVAASILAVAAGQPVVLHGAEGIPVKAGVTPVGVLKALGIRPAASPGEAEEQVGVLGITCLEQASFHPRLWGLLPRRWAVAKRTFLNTLEPHLNPLRAGCHLGSVFHPPFAERVAKALSLTGIFRRVVIIAGEEGGEELRPGGSLLVEWEEGMAEPRPSTLRPRELGLDWKPRRFTGNAVSWRAEEAARLTEDVLGRREQELGEAAVANAALRLYSGEEMPGSPGERKGPVPAGQMEEMGVVTR